MHADVYLGPSNRLACVAQRTAALKRGVWGLLWREMVSCKCLAAYLLLQLSGAGAP